MRAFAVWEPGYVRVCAICGREENGDHPPGAWFRYRPGHLRRIPIWGPRGATLGYLEYIHR